ncbi:HTH_Tnp_Tc3_2 domain-containing protein [Trichonephila clavipes]|nr:HTH_Tnp_Tc3_2 domain-containing protein [Trichonephila clavipes]
MYLAVTAKRNRRSSESDLSRQLSSATGTIVSKQTMYRDLGQAGLYVRRPVRCVPHTATHCSMWLVWSREYKPTAAHRNSGFVKYVPTSPGLYSLQYNSHRSFI